MSAVNENLARVVHDVRDASKDEYLNRVTARDLYSRGQLELDETNSKPDAPVYFAVPEAEKHPQWEAWKRWYADKYTTYIPMYRGAPEDNAALMSWHTWVAAWEATKK